MEGATPGRPASDSQAHQSPVCTMNTSFKTLFYKYRDKKSLDSLLFAWLKLKISGVIFPNLEM